MANSFFLMEHLLKLLPRKFYYKQAKVHKAVDSSVLSTSKKKTSFALAMPRKHTFKYSS